MSQLYHIYSNKIALEGNLMFWRENRQGYTPVLPYFGVYNEKEAREICESSTRAKAYKCEDIEKIAHKGLVWEKDLELLTPAIEPGIKLDK